MVAKQTNDGEEDWDFFHYSFVTHCAPISHVSEQARKITKIHLRQEI